MLSSSNKRGSIWKSYVYKYNISFIYVRIGKKKHAKLYTDSEPVTSWPGPKWDECKRASLLLDWSAHAKNSSDGQWAYVVFVVGN